MGRKIREIENTPVYGSNRLDFVKRSWSEEEQEIIDKYIASVGKVFNVDVEVKPKKVLTIRETLGKINSKRKLDLLEAYVQGARDAKDGNINIYDIYDLECLYFESEAKISSQSNKASTVSSDSVQGEFAQS
jgi:hypothetical protein